MDYYIVQPGDTIYTIAERFGVPYQRLIYDNNIGPSFDITSGQIIVIAYPESTYSVQSGDTIQSIARAHNITPLQLIQNNPFLLDRDYFNIGEELIISYPKKTRSIEINAYTFSFVNQDTLRKALPFLTYLTIANYRLSEQGNIITPDDTEIIQMAKEFGVAPIMMLANCSELGMGSFAISKNLFNNVEQQNKLLDNILYILRDRGLAGINFSLIYVLPEDLQAYTDFIISAYERLKAEGYYVFVTLVPNTFGYSPTNENNENPYYSQIGQVVDGVVLLSFQFTSAYLPTFEQTTLPFIRGYTEFILTQIPPEKIFISYTRVAYDWELPYVEGQSPVVSLANYDATVLAITLGINIEFDEYHVTPYFYYEMGGTQHFVWFKDARTLEAILEIVDYYDLRGIAIWNVMDFTTPLWLVLNHNYEIIKVMNVTSPYLQLSM